MTDYAVEMSRIAYAQREVPAAAKYLTVINGLRRELTRTKNAEETVSSMGEVLWDFAVRDVQQGDLDDRSLYWARLDGHGCLAHFELEDCGDAFELASRGLHEVTEGDVPVLLLMGFDPFHLDRDIGQSNPSGTVALALHGSQVKAASGQALTVLSVILPVRYGDFDDGIVESILEEYFEIEDVRMVVTVSMGRDGFDLERFPGRRSSSESPDNERVGGGGMLSKPIVPRGLEGPEFLEFTLPAEAMTSISGRWPVRDNRRVTSLERGTFEAASLDDLKAETAVEGSGGGFLSNEVAYRTLLWARQNNITVPMGHIHVPALRGHDAQLEQDILDQTKRLLRAATTALDMPPNR